MFRREVSQSKRNTSGFGKADSAGIRNVNCLDNENGSVKSKEKVALENKHPPRELIIFVTHKLWAGCTHTYRHTQRERQRERENT